MEVIVKKSELKGKITVPASKSVAHRLLIAAFLSGGNGIIEGRIQGKDIEVTSKILAKLKNSIDSEKGTLHRKNEFLKLDCCESGSTLRFMLPIVCALGIKAEFIGEGRLPERPLGGLIEALTKHGATVEGEKLPIRVGGRLRAGKYEIDGGVSSQYITGLLFALPILEGDSEIVLRGEIVSKSYIDITLSVLGEFGIEIVKTEQGYRVKGNQAYRVNNKLSAEGDWSSAGFLAAAGALAGCVTICGLNMNSAQGDKAVIDLLKRAGADIVCANNSVTVRKSNLNAIEFSAKDCPDLVPIMSVALAGAEGVSVIKDVDRLRLKESDRLNAVRKMLEAFSVKTEYVEDTLKIFGSKLNPGIFDGCNDHRIAMSCITGALCSDGQSVVRGCECIEKSYPDFIKDILEIGGNCVEK